MIRLVFGFLICVFVTASFVDTYPDRYDDYSDVRQEQGERAVQQLMRLFHDYKYNKENRRNVENQLNIPPEWIGRWMPEKPDNEIPLPNVLPNDDQNEFESVTESDEMPWTGRWMPDRPGDPTPPPKVLPKNERPSNYETITEFPHEMYMGHVSPKCDDAQTNLTIDWDYSPSEYTCYGHKITPGKVRTIEYCEHIPKAYKAAHKCMNQRIEYDDDIPVYGPHRPLWAVYGEYKYVPKQRWLHNLEHGAIVMLYHPCANPLEVDRLKYLVRKCLWRHIITPYSYLDENTPLALLSWGCRLTMSHVNPKEVKNFIRHAALKGPERIADDGQFEVGLLKRSQIVTDQLDSVLCPDMS